MSEALQLALVRRGGLRLAIETAVIEEVVHRPRDLGPLPLARPSVLGAFTHRGEAVAVLDLELLDVSSPSGHLSPVEYAVVLRHAGCRVALAADELLSVVAAEPAQVGALEIPPATGLYRRLYSPPSGPVAAILEPDALLALADAHLVRAGAAAATGAAASSHRFVVVACAGRRYAVDLTAVQSVDRRPEDLEAPFCHPVIRGFHRLDDTHVPVASLAAQLGYTVPDSASAEGCWIMLARGARRVAFLIDRPLTVATVAADRLSHTSENDAERFEAGCFSDREGTVVILDDADLLTAVSPEESSGDDATVDAVETDEVTAQFLVFRVGGRCFASHLAVLAKVFELSADATPASSAIAADDLVADRDGAVRLVDLGARLGLVAAQPGPGTPVLVVELPAGRVGLIVERIERLHTTVARPMPASWRSRPGQERWMKHMVRIRASDIDVTAPVLDLAAIVAA